LVATGQGTGARAHTLMESNRWMWSPGRALVGGTVAGWGARLVPRHVRPSPRARQPADTRHGAPPHMLPGRAHPRHGPARRCLPFRSKCMPLPLLPRSPARPLARGFIYQDIRGWRITTYFGHDACPPGRPVHDRLILCVRDLTPAACRAQTTHSCTWRHAYLH